ncbi:helix-turn-helix domain-containing protein [Cohaesibacter gelatinilyticus]|uniref:Transcriptional regulator, XRE family n=1 Tax=Cohaesibacter gelatinilyticus TaxID=372072 RepID=A0A285PCF0_9HYPH|nr:helix-turn-helix transcriptional regulator [Cohaesibacter gelatinilyticus]SNZ19108.1 transcriptional regulator, XRE family [Cohaesibacter gelatinilyticus]HAT85129.1 XRE family transcriptional regulator [Hyphomicrobiales bacterium]
MKKAPTAIDHHIGSRIKFRRVMLGMTQEQLGDALGTSFQQVQKYEKGINRIGASRLHNLANCLDVPITFFFEGRPSDQANDMDRSASQLAEMMKSKDCIELAMAYLAIQDKDVRKKILALVRSVENFTP